MEGRMHSGHFLEDGMEWTYWLISRLRRMKERRINLSNCMNYTRGSQTFSVHNTLNISVNFSQCPLSEKKPTMIFIYYLSPRNLINTCVTFLLSYECIFMLKLNTQKLKEKNNAFTSVLSSHDACLMECVCLSGTAWLQSWSQVACGHPHFLFHADFCMGFTLYLNNCPKSSFTKYAINWKERSVT